MATLLGTTPQYGIPSQETGLLLDSIDFTWVPEWLDQKNNMGRVCGRILVDEHVTASISGALALDGNFSAVAGASYTLVNTVPEVWSYAPVALSNHVSELSYSYSNSDVRKVNFTVEMRDFGKAS